MNMPVCAIYSISSNITYSCDNSLLTLISSLEYHPNLHIYVEFLYILHFLNILFKIYVYLLLIYNIFFIKF